LQRLRRGTGSPLAVLVNACRLLGQPSTAGLVTRACSKFTQETDCLPEPRASVGASGYGCPG
jgi:hypothetical protein